ncbi:hypothetical protein [Burkholderia gladioli]|uniref:hypothetical protein n=1 Tax=Burkholderia gladioli TaxID=28095 RepID=UPI003D245D17
MTAPAHTRHADERGQALLPALLFWRSAAPRFCSRSARCSLTSAKIQLQNTADASAYAAALLQARDYNFSAYTNRAMIANQAAVAQMVGLKSFVDMLDRARRGKLARGSGREPDQPERRGRVDQEEARGEGIDSSGARAARRRFAAHDAQSRHHHLRAQQRATQLSRSHADGRAEPGRPGRAREPARYAACRRRIRRPPIAAGIVGLA